MYIVAGFQKKKRGIYCDAIIPRGSFDLSLFLEMKHSKTERARQQTENQNSEQQFNFQFNERQYCFSLNLEFELNFFQHPHHLQPSKPIIT